MEKLPVGDHLYEARLSCVESANHIDRSVEGFASYLDQRLLAVEKTLRTTDCLRLSEWDLALVLGGASLLLLTSWVGLAVVVYRGRRPLRPGYRFSTERHPLASVRVAPSRAAGSSHQGSAPAARCREIHPRSPVCPSASGIGWGACPGALGPTEV